MLKLPIEKLTEASNRNRPKKASAAVAIAHTGVGYHSFRRFGRIGWPASKRRVSGIFKELNSTRSAPPATAAAGTSARECRRAKMGKPPGTPHPLNRFPRLLLRGLLHRSASACRRRAASSSGTLQRHFRSGAFAPRLPLTSCATALLVTDAISIDLLRKSLLLTVSP